MPGRGGERRARTRRRVRGHGRPRQRRSHARARRQPQYAALAEPGAADRDEYGRIAAGGGRHPGGRGTDGAAGAGDRAADTDDRALADRGPLDFDPGLLAGRRFASHGRSQMSSQVQQAAERETGRAQPEQPEPVGLPLEETSRGSLSWRLLANLFIGAGVNHFLMPRAYERIVPPRLRGHSRRIVQISGVAEIAGGVGVLIPATRRVSGLALIALLAAVFPANVY